METTHPAGPRLIPVSTVGTQRRSSEPRAATVRWAGTITVTTEAPVVKPNDRGFQKTLQVDSSAAQRRRRCETYGLYEGLHFVGVVYNLVAVGFVIMVFVIFFPRGLAGFGRSA